MNPNNSFFSQAFLNSQAQTPLHPSGQDLTQPSPRSSVESIQSAAQTPVGSVIQTPVQPSTQPLLQTPADSVLQTPIQPSSQPPVQNPAGSFCHFRSSSELFTPMERSTQPISFPFGSCAPSSTCTPETPCSLFPQQTGYEMEFLQRVSFGVDDPRMEGFCSCETRPNSPEIEDPNTQSPKPDVPSFAVNAPHMDCLASPSCSFIPPRCTSVTPDVFFEVERDPKERPRKVARMDSKTLNLGKLNRWKSEASLPLPEFPLPLPKFTSPHVETQKFVVLDGVRFPVVHGIGGHTNTHYFITSETAANFILGKYALPPRCKLLILDARSAPEFEGGHIKGVVNITLPGIRKQIEDLVNNARENDEKYFVLCYCEFSSARAPNLRDVIFAAEQDVMYNHRTTTELRTDEKSRFNVLIIEKGYNRFFDVNPGLCEPRGYIKEIDLPYAIDKQYRSDYHFEISDARSSYVLGSFQSMRRSKSAFDVRRQNRSENRDVNLSTRYDYASDDEYDVELTPRGDGGRINPLCFDDK